MMYRKFRGDALFTGTKLLTGGEVLVTDENGRVEDIVDGENLSDAEYLPGTICPGFVNAHCHLELSWMKGLLPQNTGMIDFLLGVMQMPRADTAEILSGIDHAEAAMLANGIVAVGDICNTNLTLAAKTRGNLYYYNFIEAMGFVEAASQTRFDQALTVFNEFAGAYPLPMACNSIVPHSPYSVSKALFQKILNFPGNQLLSIHNQEHAAENEFFLKGTGDFHRLFRAIGVDSGFHTGTGGTSLQHYLPWFKPNQSVILVHNVETGSEDFSLVKQVEKSGVQCWFCLCPNANLYINGKLPDLPLITANTDKIVVGTDSLASNTSLDIFAELKTLHRSFPEIAVEKLLQWATSNGARAFDIEDEIGSFAKGKQPGIVWLKDVTFTSVEGDAKRIL